MEVGERMVKCQFLLTGMQRSGTTLLANRLSAELKIPYLHEPFNPIFGLREDQVEKVSGSKDGLFRRSDVFKFRWKRPRYPILSRPAIISKLIASCGCDFFIKDPFWHLYCDGVDYGIPKIFCFRTAESFLASNIRRGFTFRSLIKSTVTDPSLLKAAETLDDISLVLTVYIFMAERALAEKNIIFVAHSEDSFAHALIHLTEFRVPESLTIRFIQYVNTWGRGMMATGLSFDERISTRNQSIEIPRTATKLLSAARSFEERMIKRRDASAGGPVV